MKRRILHILKYVLAGILSCLILFFAAVLILFLSIDYPEINYNSLLIKNVNIVDIKNDSILQDQPILIEENYIKEISSRPIKLDGKGNKIIDCTGTKQAPSSAYTQFVINGVMHVQDIRGTYDKRDHFASTPERIIGTNCS